MPSATVQKTNSQINFAFLFLPRGPGFDVASLHYKSYPCNIILPQTPPCVRAFSTGSVLFMQKKSRWREYFFHQFIYSDTTHFIHIYSWRSVTGSILRGLSRRLMVRILTGKTLLLMVKQCAWLVKASRMVATLLEMA
jgi:hypothetical protein